METLRPETRPLQLEAARVACQWELDMVRARFVRCSVPDVETEALLHYPYGLTVHASDLHAVVTGRLPIWDIAGVALRSWYLGAAETSPVAFLYAWFGEQLHPDLYEPHYRAKVEALGHTWRPSDAAREVPRWN